MQSSLLRFSTPRLVTLLVLTNAAATTALASNPRETSAGNNISNITELESCSPPATRIETTRSLSTYTTTSKRDLSFSNITNTRTITYDYKNWYSLLPSPAAAKSLLSFYADIRLKADSAIAASREQYLYFTRGALQFVLSCTSRSITLDVVEDIMSYMETRVRLGLLGFGKFALCVGQVSGMYMVITTMLRAAIWGHGLPLHNIIVP